MQKTNSDLNKFILLLRKDVYPDEYMDGWEKFDETTLPPKEFFHSNLNLEDFIMCMLKKYGMYQKVQQVS